MSVDYFMKIAAKLAYLLIFCSHLYGQDRTPINLVITGTQRTTISPNETFNIIAKAEATEPGKLKLRIKPDRPPFASNWDSKEETCNSACTLVDTLTLKPTLEDCGSYSFIISAQLVRANDFIKYDLPVKFNVVPQIEPEPPYTPGLANELCWTSCEGVIEELISFPEATTQNRPALKSAFDQASTDLTCETVDGLSEGTRYGYYLEATLPDQGESLVLKSDTVFSTQDNTSPPAVEIQDFAVSSTGDVTLRWVHRQDQISFIDRYIVSRRRTDVGETTFAVTDTLPFFPVLNVSPANYFPVRLDKGVAMYVDKPERIIDFPSEIEGTALIKTAAADRSDEREAFLSFDLQAPSYIYIAYEKEGRLIPDWLERDFVTTRRGILTDQASRGLLLLKSRRVYPPGRVTLGGNFAKGANHFDSSPRMYVVFVQAVDQVFPYDSGEIISHTDVLGVERDLQTFQYRIDAVDAAGNVSEGSISPPIILDLKGHCRPLIEDWFDFENESGRLFAKGSTNEICIQDPQSVQQCVGFRNTDSLRFQAAREDEELFARHRSSDEGTLFFDSGWISVNELSERFCYEIDLVPPEKEPGFVNGQQYFYRVRAKDVHGNLSVWSDTVSAIQDVFPPSDIGDLQASNRIFANREDGCIDLSWQPASDPVSGVASYIIYRSDDGGEHFAPIDSVSAESSSYCDTLSNIGQNRIVHYKIAVRDGVGNLRPIEESAWEVSLRALVGPTIVADSTGTAVCTTGPLGVKRDSITVNLTNFDAADVLGYEMDIRGPGDSRNIRIVPNLIDGGLNASLIGEDGVYQIRVRAFYANQDTTVYSNTISVRKKLRLQGVENLTAIQASQPTGDIILSWTHPDGNEITEFQIFAWPEHQSRPAQPSVILPGDSLQWVQQFDEGSLVAYQCTNYLVKVIDCLGLISEDDPVVSQYPNPAPKFKVDMTDTTATEIEVFWERPSPRFRDDDSFEAQIAIFQDSMKTTPDTMLTVSNKTSVRFQPAPMHNYIFQVREILLDDLGQSCSSSFVSEWSEPLIVPFQNPLQTVNFDAQPLPVPPDSSTGRVFLSWQGYPDKSINEFLVTWRSSATSDSMFVSNLDTALVTELDPSLSYEFAILALDDLGRRSAENFMPVSFEPPWQFTPQIQGLTPVCFRDSVKVTWDWVDSNGNSTGSSLGADSLIVEFSLDPEFNSEKRAHRLGFSKSHTFHKNEDYDFITEQNNTLYVRIRAKDRWNHLSPWSNQYPELGFESGEFDAIPPEITNCIVKSVKAPTFGQAGKVNISLQWEEVDDNCSGVWYYEIARGDSVIAIDSSGTEIHTFTEKNVKNDTTLLTFSWKVHAVDRVGNRQATAPVCTLPFIVSPPDSGSCVNDTTFCWSKGTASLPDAELKYVVEGARFAEFFGNDQTDNVLAGPMVSQCLDFVRPWEQVYWRVKAQIDSFESAWSDTFFCTLSPERNLTSVETDDSNMFPEKFQLKQNYPNPFNPTTTIRYSIPRLEENAPRVLIEIFNVSGQRIRQLVDRDMPPGDYSVLWDAKDDFGNPVGSGVYVYRMRVRDFVSTQKMIFLK